MKTISFRTWALAAAAVFALSSCDVLSQLLGGEGDPGNDPIDNSANKAIAAAAVEDGLDLLTSSQANNWEPDFDGARAKFLLAVTKDPTNAEAVAWSSVFELASIAIDPDLADILDTYLGITEYPTDFETLFMDQQDWNVAIPVSGSLVPLLLPTIALPEGLQSFTSGEQWLQAFLAGFVGRNPDGFNDLADQVVNRLFVDRLDAAVAAINALPATTKIAIPDSMTRANDPSTAAVEAVVIGKAELLAAAAYLGQLKSGLLQAQAISLALSVDNFWDAYMDAMTAVAGDNTLDPMMTIMASLMATGSPLAQGLLQPRAEAATLLAAAKAAAVKSLIASEDAANAVLARTSTSGFTWAPGSWYFPGSNAWNANMKPALRYSALLAAKTRTALTTDGVLYFPVPDTSAPQETYFAAFDSAAEWPTAANLFPSPDAPQQVIALRPAAAYVSPLFAISNLLDLNAATAEPNYYAVTADPDTGAMVIGAEPVALADVNPQGTYAVKVKDLTLGGSLVLTEEDFAAAKELLAARLAASLPPEMAAGFDLDVLMARDAATGAVSMAVPMIPGSMVTASLAETDGVSFWWNLPMMAMEFTKIKLEPGTQPVPVL
jgi:hypothetical protein